MKSLDNYVVPKNVFPLSECMRSGQPRRVERREKAARNFSVVKSDVSWVEPLVWCNLFGEKY